MEKTDYITKEYFDEKSESFVTKNYLDETLDRKFDEKLSNFVTKDYLDQKFDEKFDEFARIMANSFAHVDKKFAEQREYMDETFATKLELYETEVRINNKFDKVDEKLSKIELHVGRMEIRFSHLDDIVTNDHRPRIKNLELAVGIQ